LKQDVSLFDTLTFHNALVMTSWNTGPRVTFGKL